MGRLDGKTALITGGARGMGLATARLFVAEGARVLLADVLDDEGKAAAESLGEAASYQHLDVTSEGDWTDAVAAAEERMGSLNVLLNNAGILRFGVVDQMSPDEFMLVMRVNVLGVFLGMRAAVPAMRRAGGGSIINVSSVEGLRGGEGLTAYGGSKFAVRGMTKAAAVELGRDKIRVNAVCPGAIDTPMVRDTGLLDADLDKVFGAIPIARAGRPEDVGRVSAFLASEDAAFVTGQDFVVDGGATSFIGWGGPRPKMR
ncbi:MAG TPA: glucose 1-dehydrogenase [Actinomycetota bacterium]